MASTSIEEKRVWLAKCSKRISQLEHELRVARKLEQQLQDEIAAAISRDPPIGKLPVEILNFIFEECARLDSSITSAISMVCRMWRNIALNAPRLWSTIRVEVDMNKLDQLTVTWKQIVTYLKNSTSVGLNISLSYCGPNSWNQLCWEVHGEQWETMYRLSLSSSSRQDPDSLWATHWYSDNTTSSPAEEIFSTVHQKAMELLMGDERQHMRRWHTLEISTLLGYPIDYTFPTFFQYPMPTLERLELEYITFTPKEVIFALPALKHLVVAESSEMWYIANRCENLEVYGLEDTMLHDSLAGVLTCTNLRKLSLDFTGSLVFISSVDVATLPHLTDLYLRDVPRWMIIPFDLPSLNTLVMTGQELYFAFPQVRNVYLLYFSSIPETVWVEDAMEYYSNADVLGVDQICKERFLSTYERSGSGSHFQTLEVVNAVWPREWLREGFGAPLERIDLKTLMVTSPPP